MSFQCKMANHHHACCYAFCPLHLFENEYNTSWARCRYRTSVSQGEMKK